MKELMLAYFAAERRDGALALVAGVVALVASAWLVATRHPYRGAAIPLTLIAFIELAVGVSYLHRNLQQVPALFHLLEQSAATLRALELPRMTVALRNYQITVVLEAVLLVAGVVLGLAARRDFWFGVAMGCVIQAAPLLVADMLGTRRAAVYLRTLEALH
jgi:hypothetical protein